MAAGTFRVGTVRLVEPFGLGGGPDLIARALAGHLSERWGCRVIVENHPGGGSTAAPLLVARSRADGHTLLVNTSAHAYSARCRELPYDPLRDFVPVGPLSSQPYVLVAGIQAGATTFAELVSATRSRTAPLRFGSSGRGTATHVAVAKLNADAGIEALHVPARAADAIADTIGRVVAGETDYAMSPISIALPHLRAKELIALGVSTTRRSLLLPDVPALAEAGASGFDFPVWYGLWAPAGTPETVIDELSESLALALADQTVRGRLAAHDADPMTMTQSEFARFVESESEAAARIVNAEPDDAAG